MEAAIWTEKTNKNKHAKLKLQHYTSSISVIRPRKTDTHPNISGHNLYLWPGPLRTDKASVRCLSAEHAALM